MKELLLKHKKTAVAALLALLASLVGMLSPEARHMVGDALGIAQEHSGTATVDSGVAETTTESGQ